MHFWNIENEDTTVPKLFFFSWRVATLINILPFINIIFTWIPLNHRMQTPLFFDHFSSLFLKCEHQLRLLRKKMRSSPVTMQLIVIIICITMCKINTIKIHTFVLFVSLIVYYTVHFIKLSWCSRFNRLNVMIQACLIILW